MTFLPLIMPPLAWNEIGFEVPHPRADTSGETPIAAIPGKRWKKKTNKPIGLPFGATCLLLPYYRFGPIAAKGPKELDFLQSQSPHEGSLFKSPQPRRTS